MWKAPPRPLHTCAGLNPARAATADITADAKGVGVRFLSLESAGVRSACAKGAGANTGLPPSLPGGDVVVFSAPAPVVIREAVHLHVLFWGHRRHAAKILSVRQPGRVT